VRKARNTSDPGYYVNAEGAAEIARDLDAESAPARDLQALVLLNDHRFEDARKLASDVLLNHSDDFLALAASSDALLELGRVKEATSAVERMMALKPTHPAYTRASYLRWLNGDSDGAIEMMRLAIDAGDRRDEEPRAWAMVQAANYFWHQGDYVTISPSRRWPITRPRWSVKGGSRFRSMRPRVLASCSRKPTRSIHWSKPPGYSEMREPWPATKRARTTPIIRS
jgi:hypothetical protein